MKGHFHMVSIPGKISDLLQVLSVQSQLPNSQLASGKVEKVFDLQLKNTH